MYETEWISYLKENTSITNMTKKIYQDVKEKMKNRTSKKR